VFAKYGRACWRCGAYANTVDHAVAVVLGGSHDMSNHPWHRGRDRGRAVSNSRHLKLKPREPDEVEAAYRDELRKGCPHCRSRQVTGRFRAGLWDYRPSCKPGCRTFSEPQLAHRIAAQAAERAALATGQTRRYQAFDSSTGQIKGAVRALAGG
jgi:hypothetical protein